MQRAVAKKATKKAEGFLDPEGLFWEWVMQCTAPAGWIRYHPEVARALDSDRAALVLSSAIHLDGKGSGQYSPGRWFYKAAAEWAHDLAMGERAFRAALESLVIDWPQPRRINYATPNELGVVRQQRAPGESYSLVDRWLANSDKYKPSAVYHYRVNWPNLIGWWKAQSAEFGQLPLALRFDENVQTALTENVKPLLPFSSYWFDEKRQTSLEDIQQSTTEELDGVDAPADAGESERQIYFLLTDQMIRGITARQLAKDLSSVPLHYIQAELSRIGLERVDVLAGKKKSKIQNWEGLKVAALRELAQRGREGLLK